MTDFPAHQLTGWLLNDFAPSQGEALGVHLPPYQPHGWLPTEVPGDVHRTLVQAGRLDDPFYGTQELKAAWVQEREWWYRATFEAGAGEALQPDERLRLLFHGLDTFATIYLNGEVLGETANMFRTYSFDVTRRLQPGRNVLAVRFDRPGDHLKGRSTRQWDEGSGEFMRAAVRKAQYAYGWDWGPVLPTFGLWKAAELKREHTASLRSVHFRTVDLPAQHDRAVVVVDLEVERFADASELHADVRLTSQGGEITERRVPLNQTTSVVLELDAPDLWWTHDLGQPALYSLDVTLLSGTRILDRQQRRVGVRSVVLDQSPDPDEPGTRFFCFVLNGVPIFAKGANWIPADSFVGGLAGQEGAARYRQFLTLAQQAHMNMIRVWGGGIYEHDAFYELCDELGLLVWQDFMFACASYSEDDEMAAEVEAEARDQVRRLRPHACLALWCGNNENQWLYDVQHPTSGNKVPGSVYYDEVLPRIVRELDPQTSYWPGSPYGGNDHNSMDEGDRHNWDVWHGNRPFRRRFGEAVIQDATPDGVDPRHYASDAGRFISEFGLHAAPALSTLKTVIPGDQLFHHSPAMEHHNKDMPKNKGDNLMLNITGLPVTLHEYIDFSQGAQAAGLKLALEHYRRRAPHCSGALVWQLNDCWPCLSWSIVDSATRPKAAYYAVRNAFAPILASFRPLDDGRAELWISNQTQQTFAADLQVTLETFSGLVRESATVQVNVPPATSHPVWNGLQHQPAATREYLIVSSEDERLATNIHLFAPLHTLALSEPQLHISESASRPGELEIRSDTFVPFVHIGLEEQELTLQDNDFPLTPGRPRTLRLPVEVAWQRVQARALAVGTNMRP